MAKRGQLRVMAGAFKGRALPVPEGARPTPSRLRETLFNWLHAYLAGATVLDACAGSGILGLEALSRGAACVYTTDAQAAVVSGLLERRNALGIPAERWVLHVCRWPEESVDLPPLDGVFLDPPFAPAGLALSIVQSLLERRHLKKNAFVYHEAPEGTPSWALPYLREHRSTRAGKVRARLYFIE